MLSSRSLYFLPFPRLERLLGVFRIWVFGVLTCRMVGFGGLQVAIGSPRRR